MRTLSICVLAASVIGLVTACGSKNAQQPGTTPAASGYPGYPPPQGQYPQGAYTQQPTGYPGTPGVAPATGYPQTAGQPMPAPTMAPPTGAPAASGGPMATPGPLAFSCQNDVPCGTHHCNMQYGKCAFPCQSANDCIAPNQCLAGLCVPVPPQPH